MYGGPLRAGVRLGRCPAATSPSTSSSTTGSSTDRICTGRRGRRTPTTWNGSRCCRAARWSCARRWVFPDVVHANDWQTALAPAYINTVEWSRPLHGAATVFTIHNLAYQGNFDGGAMFITGLGREHYHPGEFEHFGDVNLMKGAIVHSTFLSTVSPTYAAKSRRRTSGLAWTACLAAVGATCVAS